ncbi:MAG TPA: response regulator, partial [Thermoanaerobaculia bacterium]|nr:response regulator [Thermoanaerobaculia bacterium]
MRASVPPPNIRALIVDDEAPSRRKIKFYLRGVADVEVAGECRTGAEAVEAIERDRPDLVFLDVQMPGMNGFDVIRELQRRDAPMPAVIFVTAYDQFALQAFEVMAVDYLLKPFNQRRFERGLERVRATLASADLQTMAARLRAVLDAAP